MTHHPSDADRRSPHTVAENVTTGAYGFVVHGLAGAREWLQPVPETASPLRIAVTTDTRTLPARSRLDEERADVRLVGGGRLRMRRGDERVRFSFREPRPDEEILHPFLAPAAALAHLWSGREALHGGAFETPIGAVAVLAEKQGGKSTTLAWLASEHGAAILTDDLIILAEGAVLAGPRCLDLREPRLLPRAGRGRGRVVRDDGRFRLSLPPAPDASILVATVVLSWGEQVRLREVPALERFRLLLPNRMYADRLEGDPSAILALAALPMLTLIRPRGSAGLRDATRALAAYFV
jgi:hypothetical protein